MAELYSLYAVSTLLEILEVQEDGLYKLREWRRFQPFLRF